LTTPPRCRSGPAEENATVRAGLASPPPAATSWRSKPACTPTMSDLEANNLTRRRHRRTRPIDRHGRERINRQGIWGFPPRFTAAKIEFARRRVPDKKGAEFGRKALEPDDFGMPTSTTTATESWVCPAMTTPRSVLSMRPLPQRLGDGLCTTFTSTGRKALVEDTAIRIERWLVTDVKSPRRRPTSSSINAIMDERYGQVTTSTFRDGGRTQGLGY